MFSLILYQIEEHYINQAESVIDEGSPAVGLD